MSIMNTRTDLSIDSEGTVYRNVGRKKIPVSWKLSDGTHHYYLGMDGISTPEMNQEVRAMVEKWRFECLICNQTVEPVKGLGVTYNCGSKQYAYTIIEVLTPKTLIIQKDKIVRGETDGQPQAVRDEYGEIKTITLRVNGCWYAEGKKMSCMTFTIGKRRFNIDPGF
jgi:hypothetical protein